MHQSRPDRAAPGVAVLFGQHDLAFEAHGDRVDVGSDEADWVVRFVNYAPPAPLQGQSRSTTMEALFEQYKKSR